MINMAKSFANRALQVSQLYGGPYYDAIIHSAGTSTYDDGGSIVVAGTPTRRTCQAQVDSVTQDMRQSDNYTDGDVRVLVLADTLIGSISLDDRVEVLAGANAGFWMIKSIDCDPFGIYFDLRGRRN